MGLVRFIFFAPFFLAAPAFADVNPLGLADGHYTTAADLSAPGPAPCEMQLVNDEVSGNVLAQMSGLACPTPNQVVELTRQGPADFAQDETATVDAKWLSRCGQRGYPRACADMYYSEDGRVRARVGDTIVSRRNLRILNGSAYLWSTVQIWRRGAVEQGRATVFGSFLYTLYEVQQ